MGNKKKCVVVFSGGVDSTAAALWAADTGYSCVELLTYRFHDERRQYGELACAAQVASHLRMKHTIIDMTIPFPAYPLTNQPFCQHNEMKDSGESLNQFGVLPFNVAIHLVYAASFAAMCGCEDVVWGTIKDEAELSADFTSEYSSLITSVLQASGSVKGNVSIVTPLIDMHKWEVLGAYREKINLFHATWSCKNSTTLTHCGTCYGCEGRRLAARIAEIDDRTVYVNELEKNDFESVTKKDIESGTVDLAGLSALLRGSGKGVMN